MKTCTAEPEGVPDHSLQWAQPGSRPGLMSVPSQVPMPLRQILDTRSIFPQDVLTAQQRFGGMAPLKAAGKHPQNERLLGKEDRDRPGLFRGPAEAAEEPTKTMQLWRDVVRVRCL